MADEGIRIEIEGLEETQRAMEGMLQDLSGDMMVDAMRQATLVVQRAAKQLVPVDTGRLRASITPEVVKEAEGIAGIVGSNVVYGPYVETGTRPHWPPPGALDVWARRHGMDPFVVARVIGMKGTQAHPYLVPAFEQNLEQIERIIGDKVTAIVEKAGE
jgi:HK97 gp10 family phage protein